MTDSSPPEPLTLDQVKLNLKVSSNAENDLITDLIVDAREFVERETGLVLKPCMITETAQQLGRWIDLASWPVTAVTAIRYPLNGALAPLAQGSWLFSPTKRPVRLLPASSGWALLLSRSTARQACRSRSTSRPAMLTPPPSLAPRPGRCTC